MRNLKMASAELQMYPPDEFKESSFEALIIKSKAEQKYTSH